MIFYLLIICFLLSLVLSALFSKLGKKYKLHDQANDDPLKIHTKSVSVLGGLAIFLTVYGVLFFKMAIERDFNARFLWIMLAGFLIFLLGVVDDIIWRDRYRIARIYKFLFLVLFSLVATLLVFKADIALYFFNPPSAAVILSFFLLFVLINSVNYQDGMDGQAGGTVFISLIGFIVLSIISGNSTVYTISFLLASAILGFLVLNFPPAKIFMGDSGAYFLGFMLTVLAEGFFKPYNLAGAIGLFFVLGLPLFDGIFTNLRRLVAKKSIFIGDRSHFFDRVYNRTGSVAKTLFISCGVQIIFVLIGILIYANTSV